MPQGIARYRELHRFTDGQLEQDQTVKSGNKIANKQNASTF